LDYYTRTAFEVVAKGLGAQDAVAGGGRYNGLSQALGGPMLPAIGFAIGEDRLLEVLPRDLGQGNEFKVFLAALGEPARDKAFGLLQELRRRNVAAEMDLEGRSLKAQMTQADRYGAAYTVILGDREMETGEAQLRRMAEGSQERVALKDLTTLLAARAKG
jgi:histidyl-tRNA synthetase